MATTQEFADKVCRRMAPFGDVRSRKMFGEYLVYVNEKPVLALCDGRVFVKKLPQLAALMATRNAAIPTRAQRRPICLISATMRGSMRCSRCSWSIRRCPSRAKRKRNKTKRAPR